MAEATHSYEVLESETVHHSGKEYTEGQTLELSESDAKILLEKTIIKKVGTPSPSKPKAGEKKSPGGELMPPTGGIPKPVSEV